MFSITCSNFYSELSVLPEPPVALELSRLALAASSAKFGSQRGGILLNIKTNNFKTTNSENNSNNMIQIQTNNNQSNQPTIPLITRVENANVD